MTDSQHISGKMINICPILACIMYYLRRQEFYGTSTALAHWYSLQHTWYYCCTVNEASADQGPKQPYLRCITEIATDACCLYTIWRNKNHRRRTDRARKRQMGHCQDYYCLRPSYESQAELAYLRIKVWDGWDFCILYWMRRRRWQTAVRTVAIPLSTTTRYQSWRSQLEISPDMAWTHSLYDTSEGRGRRGWELYCTWSTWYCPTDDGTYKLVHKCSDYNRNEFLL